MNINYYNDNDNDLMVVGDDDYNYDYEYDCNFPGVSMNNKTMVEWGLMSIEEYNDNLYPEMTMEVVDNTKAIAMERTFNEILDDLVDEALARETVIISITLQMTVEILKEFFEYVADASMAEERDLIFDIDVDLFASLDEI